MQDLDEAYENDYSIEELDNLLEEKRYYWEWREEDGYYFEAEY